MLKIWSSLHQERLVMRKVWLSMDLLANSDLNAHSMRSLQSLEKRSRLSQFSSVLINQQLLFNIQLAAKVMKMISSNGSRSKLEPDYKVSSKISRRQTLKSSARHQSFHWHHWLHSTVPHSQLKRCNLLTVLSSTISPLRVWNSLRRLMIHSCAVSRLISLLNKREMNHQLSKLSSMKT